MKNFLKFLPFFLLSSLLVIGCGNDEEDEPDNSCTTDPTVTVAENILGTWVIDGDASETVTFNSNGTGSSSEGSFEFSTSNDGKEYNNFGWAMEGDTVVVVTYDYSPDIPVVPYIISEDYTVLLNNCDKIEMEGGFGSEVELTK